MEHFTILHCKWIALFVRFEPRNVFPAYREIVLAHQVQTTHTVKRGIQQCIALHFKVQTSTSTGGTIENINLLPPKLGHFTNKVLLV